MLGGIGGRRKRGQQRMRWLDGITDSMDMLLLLSCFSRVRLCATPWTAAYQASPSMGFSRREHWSGLPFPSPRDLPNPGIEPMSPALADDRFFTTEPPGKLMEYYSALKKK